MTHGRFGVKTIEVQNIDAPGGKSFARLVKARTDESRERLVILSIVRGDLCKRRLVIAARMLIATPRIDPKTSGARLVFRRRLAKGEVAFAAIDAQLDEHARFHRGDKIVGEMQVVRPRAHPIDVWRETARGQSSINLVQLHGNRTTITRRCEKVSAHAF